MTNNSLEEITPSLWNRSLAYRWITVGHIAICQTQPAVLIHDLNDPRVGFVPANAKLTVTSGTSELLRIVAQFVPETNMSLR